MIQLSASIGMGRSLSYDSTAVKAGAQDRFRETGGRRIEETDLEESKKDELRKTEKEKEEEKQKGLRETDREEEKKKKLPGLEKEEEEKRKKRLGLDKEEEERKKKLLGLDEEDDKAKGPNGKKGPGQECQTCKNRRYKDGSDEMVSFKSPTHISPESAASAVRAHEQEHVSNAYKKAAMRHGKVLAASVSIHMAVCPECGRTYVAGGTTHTQIKYYNEDNPYQKGLKTADSAKYSGMNLDYGV